MKADQLFRRACQNAVQPRDDLGLEALVLGRDRVQDLAAAGGADRGIAAHHEVVALDEGHGGVEPQLGHGGLTRLELLAFEQDQVAEDLARPGVEPHPGAVFQGLGVARQIAELDVHHVARLERVGAGEHLAAVDRLLVQPLEIDGRAQAGLGRADALVVDLDAAHLGGDAGGVDHDGFAHLDPARNEGAGDDRAETLHAEHPVHRQAEQIRGRSLRDLGAQGVQGLDEFRDPLAGDRRDRNDGRFVEKGSPDEILDVLGGELEHLLVHHVDLGQHHQTVAHPEQGADLHVLAGLGHDPLVGRDDHGHDVDPGGAGHHVLDELLVARDVDHPQVLAARQVDVREPELDRDPALLLLLEAVGVDARGCLDQRGLAVVDVPGRA